MRKPDHRVLPCPRDNDALRAPRTNVSPISAARNGILASVEQKAPYIAHNRSRPTAINVAIRHGKISRWCFRTPRDKKPPEGNAERRHYADYFWINGQDIKHWDVNNKR